MSGTRITEGQRRLHVAGETAALVVVVPFMAWIATRKDLPPAARALGAAIGATTLILDGVLLSRYLSQPKSSTGVSSSFYFP
jgi:hypothetical protein